MKTLQRVLPLLCLFLMGSLSGCGNPSHEYEGDGSNKVQEGPVDFAVLKSSVLKSACLRCHSGRNPDTDLNLSTYESIIAFQEMTGNPLFVAGEPEQSLLYTIVVSGEMPKDSPLSPEKQEILRKWILEGAKP